uniref:Putative transport protein n=2 Tax=Mycobacterium avium TaxID=1764 RepID=Q83UU3_MYCAV|nr:putative transport protein [Mycobacterium avium subsp. paratuberculosis]AAP31444.1 putative transport protein [Mycobacterium avium]AAP31447.1 putative transport protein [Mycobacterium avium]AAP31449.1 putative transport protein [Mycobacterium avium]AAP31451.1 putative transport protein [Mycobacterium avium]
MSASGSCHGWLLGLPCSVVAQQCPQDVDVAACQGKQGLGVDMVLGSFAVVESPRGTFDLEAGQGGEVEHAAQAPVVALGPMQIAGDTAGIAWDGYQSGERCQSAGVGEGGHVAAGDYEELSAQVWPHAGHRLDDGGAGMLTKFVGDLLIDVLDLPIQVQQPCCELLDERGGSGFAGKGDYLACCRGEALVGDRVDVVGPCPVFPKVLDHASSFCRPDFARSAHSGYQDQRRAGGVVERSFQSREDGGEHRAHAVHASHPVSHQIRPVCGQRPQFGNQVFAGYDRGQISSVPSGFGDYPRVFGVGLAFAAERMTHRVNRAARHIHHLGFRAQQYGDQQPPPARGQIDRPHHVVSNPAALGDQVFDRGLFVRDFLRPHHLSGVIDRARMMSGLTDVDTHPHSVGFGHTATPVVAVPADNPANRSLEQRHRVRVRSQSVARTVQNGRAAIPFKQQPLQQHISHTPPSWASRTSNPRPLQP